MVEEVENVGHMLNICFLFLFLARSCGDDSQRENQHPSLEPAGLNVVTKKNDLLKVRNEEQDENLKSPRPKQKGNQSVSLPKQEPISNGVPLLTFSRDNAIWLAELDGSGAHRVLDDPEAAVSGVISPDGQRIAFAERDASDSSDAVHVALYNLTTKGLKVFREVSGKKSTAPSWSTCGQKLVFKTMNENGMWTLGTIDVTGNGFRRYENVCSSPRWSDRGIYCYSMRELFLIGSTDLVKRWEWKEILGSLWSGVSSPMPFVPSRDGSKLLLVLSLGESEPPWIPSGAFVYDFKTKSLRRITPETHTAHSVAWLSNEDAILFSGVRLTPSNRERLIKDKPIQVNIYRINLDGTGLKQILKNADLPSVSLGRPEIKGEKND